MDEQKTTTEGTEQMGESVKMVDLIGCPDCGRSYLQKNIYRHLWNQHNWSKEECRQLISLIKTEKRVLNGGNSYVCRYCGATFKAISSMMKHKKVCLVTPHNEEEVPAEDQAQKTIMDEIIDPIYVEESVPTELSDQVSGSMSTEEVSTSSQQASTSTSLEFSSNQSEEQDHQQREGEEDDEEGTKAFLMSQEKLQVAAHPRFRASTISCPECQMKLETCDDLVFHCQQKHEIEGRRFVVEQESFANYQDFRRWFDQRQEDSCTSLTKRTGHGGETFYRCHMIGKYKSVANKRKSNPRKIDQHCTAFLKVFVHNDGTTYACGCFTHIGHELNHRLLWLTETQENYVKELIELGWTADQIYYYIREEYSNYECKLKYISKNDIRNISVRLDRLRRLENLKDASQKMIKNEIVKPEENEFPQRNDYKKLKVADCESRDGLEDEVDIVH